MFNINDFIVLYRDKLRAVGVTGSTVRIQNLPLRSGRLRSITHVTVENQTSPYTKLRIGISNAGEDFYLDELDSPAADELVVGYADILLGDRDRLFAELTGTVTRDFLVLPLAGGE